MGQSQSDQIETQQIPSQALENKRNPWIFVTACLFLIVLTMVAFVWRQSLNQSSMKDRNEPSVTTAILPTNASSIPQGDSVFEDMRLEGMKFAYDASRWEVIQFSADDDNIVEELKFVGEGVLLRDNHSQDKLVMKYALPFGMGPGIQLVLPDRLVRLQNGLIRTRFKDSNKYTYGLDNALVLFQNSQKDYNSLLASCKAERETPGQQIQILDAQDCSDLEANKAIGFLELPAFQYSLRFKNLVNLTEIDSSWVDVNEVFEDYVIVEVSYEGSNPTSADEIVQQIVR